MGNFKRFSRGHIGLQVLVLLAGFGSVVFGTLAFDFPTFNRLPESPAPVPRPAPEVPEHIAVRNPLDEQLVQSKVERPPMEQLFEDNVVSESETDVEPFRLPVGRIALGPEELSESAHEARAAAFEKDLEGEGGSEGEGEGEGEGAYLGTMTAPLILTSELVTPPSGSIAIAAGELSYEAYENIVYVDIDLTHNVPDADALLLRDVVNDVTLVTIPVTGAEIAYRLTESDLEDIADAEENNDGVIAAILTSDRFPSGELQGVPRTTRYVRWSSTVDPEEQTGESWTSAYTEIQRAIDDVATEGGGDVWVAQGFYGEERDAVEAPGALVLRDNVRVFGSFHLDDTSYWDRDIRTNLSLILPGGSGLSPVVHADGIAQARLDGFSICGGAIIGMQDNEGGGGIRVSDSGLDLVLANLRIAGNLAMPVGLMAGEGEGEGEGEALSLLASGGGIHLTDASPLICNTSIYGNLAFGTGGGIYMVGSAPSLENVLLAGNMAVGVVLAAEPEFFATEGGALYADENSAPELANTVIFSNAGLEQARAMDIGPNPAELSLRNGILTGHYAAAHLSGDTVVDYTLSTSSLGAGTGNILGFPLWRQVATGISTEVERFDFNSFSIEDDTQAWTQNAFSGHLLLLECPARAGIGLLRW